MNQQVNIKGQWVGHFTYGEEYGKDLFGEKVIFRLFIDSFEEEQFIGRSIDIEGVGANFGIAHIKGFIEGNQISFTKEYPNFYAFDISGKFIEEKNKKHPLVNYLGEYNESTQTFSGTWELNIEIKPIGQEWLEDTCTGLWEIRKDD